MTARKCYFPARRIPCTERTNSWCSTEFWYRLPATVRGERERGREREREREKDKGRGEYTGVGIEKFAYAEPALRKSLAGLEMCKKFRTERTLLPTYFVFTEMARNCVETSHFSSKVLGFDLCSSLESENFEF